MKDVFPDRFRAARKGAGLTLDDIAEVCKNRDGEQASRAAIAQWESNKKGSARPTFNNLIAAAKRIGVSIDYLVGLTDEEKPSSVAEESTSLMNRYRRAGDRDRELVQRILKLDPTVNVASDEKVSRSIKPIKTRKRSEKKEEK